MTTNAALLARVSTSGQENNSSLDAQLERGRAHCDKMHYNIYTERKEIMSGALVLRVMNSTICCAWRRWG